MKVPWNWLLERLSEPSSYAGLVGILVYFGLPHAQDVAGDVTQVGVGLAGLVAFVLKEKGKSL